MKPILQMVLNPDEGPVMQRVKTEEEDWSQDQGCSLHHHTSSDIRPPWTAYQPLISLTGRIGNPVLCPGTSGASVEPEHYLISFGLRYSLSIYQG